MKKLNLTLLLIFLSGFAFAQNPLVKQWDYRFGGTSDDGFTCFQQTSDGGYILAGESYSGISGDKTQANWNTTGSTTDYWIVKIDSLGNKQWDKDFGGISGDSPSSIQQTGDGGYILGGTSKSGISGDKTQPNWDTIGFITSDYWIIKIDSLGSKQWDKDFGGTDDEDLSSLQQTADGGYILGGTSTSDSSGDKTQDTWGNSDYWIIKIDSLGNKQWDKDFGGNGQDELHFLQHTSDKGYILGGFSSSDSSGDKTQNTWGTEDYWIIKVDSLGNKQWDKDFGGTSSDGLYSVRQTADGGYILGGYSASDSSGDKTQNTWGMYDYWNMKIDSLGNKQWDKDFGGIDNEDQPGNIFQTLDGGYFISGTSFSDISGDKTENNLGIAQAWVVKTDSIGIKQWDKTIFTTGYDEQGQGIQSIDGCFLIANTTNGGIGGYKTQPSRGLRDYWIIKFCDTTLTTNVTPTLSNEEGVVLAPNPFSDKLTITTANNSLSEIILYDIASRKLLQQKFTGSVTLNTAQLARGIYIYEVRGKEGVRKGKVVKE